MSHQPVIYYVVTLEQGEHWDARLPMRQQQHWDEHARLMDAFIDDGFIILGGPLDGEERILLVINAESRQAIEARFAVDPWIAKGVRRIAKVEHWEILLDARQERVPPCCPCLLRIPWEEGATVEKNEQRMRETEACARARSPDAPLGEGSLSEHRIAITPELRGRPTLLAGRESQQIGLARQRV